jgi:putative CocE/NonD family hydrolase
LDVRKFGVPAEWVSGLQSFEALDPGRWCDYGYALVVVDAAGTSHSGGDEVFMGSASARNVYDVIEWAAAQGWCTGKVGMAGISQLAMIQWAVAELQPPHLAAIAPTESCIDLYREVDVRGVCLTRGSTRRTSMITSSGRTPQRTSRRTWSGIRS